MDMAAYHRVMENIREEFDNVIAQVSDPQTVAELEICREYFTNPEFKANLEEFTWNQNQQLAR